MVLSNELDPYKCLLKQINSERYDAIENILYIIGQEGFEGDWFNPAHSGR